MKNRTKEKLENWYRQNKTRITFRGVDDTILEGASFTSPEASSAIFFINGRSDNIKQYSETYHDLIEQTGANVYAIDHRGQGFSSRLTDDSYRGHVDSYEDYAEDLNIFYKKFIEPKNYERFYIASHSMGGAASILWLLDNDIRPDAMFMTAPLFGAIAPIPEWLGMPLAWIACTFGFSKSLIPTVGKPNIGGFSSNKLTKDEERYSIMCDFNRLDDGTPNLVKPTNGWALASYRVMSRIRKEIQKLSDIETILFQAEEEQYVDNSYHIEYTPDNWEIKMLKGENHHLWHCREKAREEIFSSIVKVIKRDDS